MKKTTINQLNYSDLTIIVKIPIKIQPIPPKMIEVQAVQPGMKIADNKNNIPRPIALNAEKAIDLEADTN